MAFLFGAISHPYTETLPHERSTPHKRVHTSFPSGNRGGTGQSLRNIKGQGGVRIWWLLMTSRGEGGGISKLSLLMTSVGRAFTGLGRQMFTDWRFFSSFTKTDKYVNYLGFKEKPYFNISFLANPTFLVAKIIIKHNFGLHIYLLDFFLLIIYLIII